MRGWYKPTIEIWQGDAFLLYLHPDVYRVGFTYYANQKDVEIGKESVYGYDIQVDSEYMITIKEKSVAIGEDLWSENTEIRKIKIQ